MNMTYAHSGWTELSESEWLSKWLGTSERLEQVQQELMDPETEIAMTDMAAAHLDGEIVMLRRLLRSRGL